MRSCVSEQKISPTEMAAETQASLSDSPYTNGMSATFT